MRLRDPGVYILIIRVYEDCIVKTRGGRIFNIRKGLYIYVGSALRGVESRIRRYLNIHRLEKPHWHIDYLLSRCRTSIVSILCSSLKYYKMIIRAETMLSFTLSSVRYLDPIKGFGSTDIRHVKSNLYYVSHNKSMRRLYEELKDILQTLFKNVVELKQQD